MQPLVEPATGGPMPRRVQPCRSAIIRGAGVPSETRTWSGVVPPRCYSACVTRTKSITIEARRRWADELQAASGLAQTHRAPPLRVKPSLPSSAVLAFRPVAP